MASDFLNPAAKKPEVPFSLAALVSMGFLIFLAWLSSPSGTERAVGRLGQFEALNRTPLLAVGLSLAFNALWVKLICLHIENDALARSIGTLLKLLYQEAVLARVADPGHDRARHALLVMDEYQDVATSGGGAGLGDDRFLAKARESKAITIAATQSVSSLENAIRSEPATRETLQNFRTRIFGNSTDPKTSRETARWLHSYVIGPMENCNSFEGGHSASAGMAG